jgi:hypothetical protein
MLTRMIVADGHGSIRHGEARDGRKNWPAYRTRGWLSGQRLRKAS